MTRTAKLIDDMAIFYKDSVEHFVSRCAYKEAVNDTYKRLIMIVGTNELLSVNSFIARYNEYQTAIINSSEVINAKSKVFETRPCFLTGVESVQLKRKETYKTYNYSGARLARKLQLLRRSLKEKADKELLDDEMLFFRQHKDDQYIVRKSGYSELTATLTMCDGSQQDRFVKQGILFLYEPNRNVLVNPPAASKQYGVRKPRNKYSLAQPMKTALELNGKLYPKIAIDNIYNK